MSCCFELLLCSCSLSRHCAAEALLLQGVERGQLGCRQSAGRLRVCLQLFPLTCCTTIKYLRCWYRVACVCMNRLCSYRLSQESSGPACSPPLWYQGHGHYAVILAAVLCRCVFDTVAAQAAAQSMVGLLLRGVGPPVTYPVTGIM